MSQTAVESVQTQVASLKLNAEKAPRLDLKKYPRIELTPAIGLRFDAGLKFSDILKKPQEEKEAFFKALAYEISLNGVAVFPRQTDLSDADLEDVAEYLQKYSGAPSDGGFHIHPTQRDFDTTKKGGNIYGIGNNKIIPNSPPEAQDIKNVKIASSRWHSDVSFEPRPATYSLLQVNVLPRTGGDTLFLSNYAIYDKLTPQLQKFVEKLSASHSGAVFNALAEKSGYDLYEGPRGAPENFGTNLQAVHPVVRTNPLTNLKAVFVNTAFTKYIEELNSDESEALLKYLYTLQAQSHDAIVRHKWEKDDLVIWDNRSTNHTATFDYGFSTRIARRSTVVGEVPFLDPSSLSKKQFEEIHPPRLDLPEIQI